MLTIMKQRVLILIEQSAGLYKNQTSVTGKQEVKVKIHKGVRQEYRLS